MRSVVAFLAGRKGLAQVISAFIREFNGFLKSTRANIGGFMENLRKTERARLLELSLPALFRFERDYPALARRILKILAEQKEKSQDEGFVNSPMKSASP